MPARTMPLDTAVKKVKTLRQVIDPLQLKLCAARGKTDDLAFDRLCVRAEQKPSRPRDQALRRHPEPTSFI